MESKISNSNIFMRFMIKVYQLMVLNAMFMITALPMVTIGASFAALSACIKELFDGSLDQEVKTFIYYFRSNFTKTTMAWLLFLVCSILVSLNFMFVSQINWLLATFQLTIGLQLLVTYFCLNYVIVNMDMPFLKTLKMSWIIGNKYIVQIIGCLGVSYMLLKICSYSPFLILFFFISIYSILQHVFVFKTLENKINGGTI